MEFNINFKIVLCVCVFLQEKSKGNCGNFRVDEDEECDEVPLNVNISCCNRLTCKLKPAAVCRSSCCA